MVVLFSFGRVIQHAFHLALLTCAHHSFHLLFLDLPLIFVVLVALLLLIVLVLLVR